MTRVEAIRFGENILALSDDEDDSNTIEFTKMAIDAIKKIQDVPEWKYKVRYARRYRICPICYSGYEDDKCTWFYCPTCGTKLMEGE